MKKAISYIIMASIISLTLISCDKKSTENEIKNNLKETTISNSKEDKKITTSTSSKEKTTTSKKEDKNATSKNEETAISEKITELSNASSVENATTSKQEESPAQNSQVPDSPTTNPAVVTNQPATNPPATEKPKTSGSISLDDFYIRINNEKIRIDDKIDEVKSKIGDPITEEIIGDCFFNGNGEDKSFNYDGFYLRAYSKTKEYLLFEIKATSDKITTSKGITVNMSLDDVIAAYGENYEQSGNYYYYRINNQELSFLITDNKIKDFSLLLS